MQIGQFVRQGDVLVTRVSEIPAEAQEVARHGKPIIFALGEVTGHQHAIYADEATEHVVLEAERIVGRYARALDAVPVQHEEHTEHVLPPGCYRVGIQVEENDDGVRNVAD